MNYVRRILIPLLMVGLVFAMAGPSGAAVSVQCPGDTDGDAEWNSPGETQPANTKCMHLSAGDGFIRMEGRADPMYIFGFSDVTGTLPADVMSTGALAQNFSAPNIILDQGDEFYLTLTNVGMMIRPDLFDPHTVHYHGFPESSNIFDGLPESAIAINMGSSLTYYFLNNEPGTYMYHCHVEATEHMQMGMLGSLYVHADQDRTGYGGDPNTVSSRFGGPGPLGYAYNDGDGSTRYDVELPIQLGSFDSAFHDASGSVQTLPFALMRDNYPMLNGRGYPATVGGTTAATGAPPAPPEANPISGNTTQPVSSTVTASVGQKILLRLSNLAVTRLYTLTSLGIPMQVVGKDAKLLRGPGGKDLYYTTNSVTMGGGQSYDVILDTTGVAPGTYFLYAADLNYLSSNYEQQTGTWEERNAVYGGMMTEIEINP